MLGGLDYHSIAAHVKRALSTVGVSLGSLSLNVLSPAQLTANTNNWNPAGFDTSSTIRFSTDASRNITGLIAGTDGQIKVLHNVGAQPAVLKDEDANSDAGNRFALDSDVTLQGDQAVVIQYDGTSSRWRVVRVTNGEYRSVQVFTGSGTWTKPAGLKRVQVTVVAGGGGSGGAPATGAAQCSGSCGGGGAGAAIKLISAASLGATETVTVGAAGGNNGAGVSATNGGSSSFGAHCSATGGTGSVSNEPSATVVADGPAAGVGTGGDVNLSGESGHSLQISKADLGQLSPPGGSSFPFGPGGRGTSFGQGLVPGGYGGGAGGNARNESLAATNGTSGAPGIVIVEEFF